MKRRITRRQLRRIIREVKHNEAPAPGLLWFQEGTDLYDQTMVWAKQVMPHAQIPIREENGGVWVVDPSPRGRNDREVEAGKKSWCEKPGRWQTELKSTRKKKISPADWFAVAQDTRAGRPLRPELNYFEGKIELDYEYFFVLGRLLGADLSMDPSAPGFTGCAKKKKKTAPVGPGPYLESGSIGELMDLDPEEFPEVDGLIADYSALSAAQKIALGKIEDIGYGDASVADFMKVLKQVRPQNFLSAFDAVASTIRQIEYGSADTLYQFYSEVAELAR